MADGLNDAYRRLCTAHEFEVVGGKTSSFGIAAFHRGDTETALVKRADDSLYRAKEGGRNRGEQTS